MDSKVTGNLGENIAGKFLRDKGYRILDKNYSSKFVSGPQRGEIDIIAKKDGIISFVEVKTLSDSPAYGPLLAKASDGQGRAVFNPEDKVDYQKQRKIIKTAEAWLVENKIPFNSKWQIDVVAIVIDKVSQKAQIKHFENI